MSPAIETLVKMSPGMVEMSLLMVKMSLGQTRLAKALEAALQTVEISMQALMLEIELSQSFLMDLGLITIFPEMLEASTHTSRTLIRMSTRQRQYQIGSGIYITEKEYVFCNYLLQLISI